jgi:hypothetical protein
MTLQGNKECDMTSFEESLLCAHGGTLYQGSTWVEWTDEISIGAAAEAEAGSIVAATAARLQTTISPSSGQWVSWSDSTPAEVKKKFHALVNKLLTREGHTSINFEV